MMRFLALLLLAVSLQAAPTFTTYEVDGTTQTNRITKMAYVFVDGDITANQFPQPVVNGTPATVWQADVKNRYASGSPRFALLAYQETLSSGGNNVITFQSNASASSAGGGLTQAQMINFNGGSWGAQQEITGMGTGTTVLRNAATMLGNTDPATFPDCGNNYWRKGPAVTEVIVQDCTSTTLYDAGWTWNGTTMGAFCGTAAVGGGSGNGTSCSLHPAFILSFYSTLNVVEVSFILENARINRTQDQAYDWVLKTGVGLSQVYAQTGAKKITTDLTVPSTSTNVRGSASTTSTSPFVSGDVGSTLVLPGSLTTTITGFTDSKHVALARGPNATLTNITAYENLQIHNTRRRKIFWSGTAQGNIRIDYNMPYLSSTGAIPNYDTHVSVSPDSGHDDNYTNVVGASDQGDGMGDGLFRTEWQGGQGYSANNEGAILQRNDVQLLYSMGANCGTANSNCAKAYYINTGIHGLIDSGLAANISGGAGLWERQAHIPNHYREGRTVATGVIVSGNAIHCPNLADKNAKDDGTNPVAGNGCGTGTGIATGKPLSKHAHSADQNVNNIVQGTQPGTFTLGGWSLESDAAHWQDWAYLPYLLTGDYYYYEELMFAGAAVTEAQNAGHGDASNSAGPFAFFTGTSIRGAAWGDAQLAHTLYGVTDFDFDGVTVNPFKSYFTAVNNSNAEIWEGAMGKTGTSLTPVSTNSSCTSYNAGSANRWDYGRCSFESSCYLTNGTNCPVVVTQALHALGPGECGLLYGNGTVGSHQYWITAGTDLGGGVTQFTTPQTPVNGEVVVFMSGVSPWDAINGKTLTATFIDATHFTVPFTSTGFSSVVGSLKWGSHGVGTLTAATSANPSIVTTTTVSQSQLAAMWGGTGAWTALNGYGTFCFGNGVTCPGLATNQLKTPFNTNGLAQPPTGTIWWSNFMVDHNAVSALMSNQEHDFQVAMGLELDLGFTNFTSVADEALARIAEMLQDTAVNHFLVGQYSRPYMPPGSQQCTGTATPPNNQFFSSWANWEAAWTPTAQADATFNADGTLNTAQCDDHAYGLKARAASAYAQSYNVAGTCVGCTTIGAFSWMNTHFPYFNNSPPESAGCGSSDIQAKFAIAPRLVAGCVITGPSSPLPDGTINVAYTPISVTTSGCAAPSFALSGSPPTGITINASSGSISGTPTASGVFSFNVNVTDANGNPTQAYGLTITPGLTVTPSTLPDSIFNVAYSTTMSASGGTAPYTWLDLGGHLPSGLSISSGGVVSGTPTVVGVFTTTIRATDNVGAFRDQAVTITVTNFGTGMRVFRRPN